MATILIDKNVMAPMRDGVECIAGRAGHVVSR
jgi:hypothetical protein